MTWRIAKWWDEVKSAGDIDGEFQPIKCICGYGENDWFAISIYKNTPKECPICGRKYYFTCKTTIYVDESNISK